MIDRQRWIRAPSLQHKSSLLQAFETPSELAAAPPFYAALPDHRRCGNDMICKFCFCLLLRRTGAESQTARYFAAMLSCVSTHAKSALFCRRKRTGLQTLSAVSVANRRIFDALASRQRLSRFWSLLRLLATSRCDRHGASVSDFVCLFLQAYRRLLYLGQAGGGLSFISTFERYLLFLSFPVTERP